MLQNMPKLGQGTHFSLEAVPHVDAFNKTILDHFLYVYACVTSIEKKYFNGKNREGTLTYFG